MKALTDDDEDWEAAIARAKLQAAVPRALGGPRVLLRQPSTKVSSPPPPPHVGWIPPELQITPPPLPVRPVRAAVTARPQAPARSADRVRAKLDVVDWGGVKRPGSLWPAEVRRRAEQELATPPPVTKRRWAPGPLPGPTKRP